VKYLVLATLLLALVGCSAASSFLRGAADGMERLDKTTSALLHGAADNVDELTADDAESSGALENLAYTGGGLATVLLGLFLGGKYITAKRDRLNGA